MFQTFILCYIEVGGIITISQEININCEIELTNIGFKDLKMKLESTYAEKKKL